MFIEIKIFVVIDPWYENRFIIIFSVISLFPFLFSLSRVCATFMIVYTWHRNEKGECHRQRYFTFYSLLLISFYSFTTFSMHFKNRVLVSTCFVSVCNIEVITFLYSCYEVILTSMIFSYFWRLHYSAIIEENSHSNYYKTIAIKPFR